MTVLGFVLGYGLLAVFTLALVWLEAILGTTRPCEELVFANLS